MCNLVTDTIGGFNQFIKDQKDVPGEAILTLCTFSTMSTIVHDSIPLKDVPDLDTKTYIPSGGIALLDAFGSTIDSVGTKLAAMDEADRPSKVIFLIITDGAENSSTSFSARKIKEMVQHQQKVYNWEFVFMGANLDSISEGEAIGISPCNTMNYSATPIGTRNLYVDVSKSMTRYRTNGSSTAGFFENEEESK